MEQPPDPAGPPFQPATEKARLARLSRSHLMSMICWGTIAAAPPGPARDFAAGCLLRMLGQRPNGNSGAHYPPAPRDR